MQHTYQEGYYGYAEGRFENKLMQFQQHDAFVDTHGTEAYNGPAELWPHMFNIARCRYCWESISYHALVREMLKTAAYVHANCYSRMITRQFYAGIRYTPDSNGNHSNLL